MMLRLRSTTRHGQGSESCAIPVIWPLRDQPGALRWPEGAEWPGECSSVTRSMEQRRWMLDLLVECDEVGSMHLDEMEMAGPN